MSKFLWRQWSRFVHAERGDVPGWVLITLMTAGLVAAIFIVARPALEGVFQRAIDMITGGIN